MNRQLYYRAYVLVIFNKDVNMSWAHEIQDDCQKDHLIYVSLDGTEDRYLHPDRFLIKNYEASLTNHFMWEGLFTVEEQEKRMFEMIDTYIDTGKQYTIENYDFVKDEPFYDYSGG